eukprot:CAMPEP_0180572768 /NCGR_PEP_ID=MMETSP1037_2-20121125/9417_1 /TAXON_ID=632150 /ORGANISM="Azadinium spinosum, Strain 3D9" /LENGTH=349 /DNA_ID=CAMNT_0022590151 /DNA_START=1 /DNA_END=1050 /DNA_ORIENTATION=+
MDNSPTELRQLLFRPRTEAAEVDAPPGLAGDGADVLCVICQASVAAADRRRTLLCGHSHWHEECILLWLQEQCTCPICRAEVPAPEGCLGRAAARVAAVGGAGDEDDEAEEVALQAAREHLTARMQLLEEERSTLEWQVRMIEGELITFRSQLLRLHLERLTLDTLCTTMRWPRSFLPRGETPLLDAGAHRRPGVGTASVAMATADAQAQVTASVAGASAADAEALAEAMLVRLRGAVLRTPLPGIEVFRALSAQTGHLGPGEVARVLRGLDASASSEVLAAAFLLLDVNASGSIEETDWMAALRLPRLGPPTTGAATWAEHAAAMCSPRTSSTLSSAHQASEGVIGSG